jgi:eukaryotic-like serine/threonine-protein kinase
MPEETSTSSPLSQSCPDCGAMVDISSEAPLSQVLCPVCGTTMRARTQFNNFMLEAEIGVGGMGVVYKALDVNLNRLVALKVVLKEYSSDPSYHAKFEHEARITAQVNHPHVVKVYSFGSDHGLFYIAMELVDRGSLDELINQEGKLSEARVLETGVQIAQGLNAALKRGLIHRDVKPGNILYADEHTAKIVDFGLAVPLERGAEGGKPGEEVWGTPYYIAPEKLTHEPEDFRSDIYSLGASLFHAIAGRPCFEGETTSLGALRQLKSKPMNLETVAPGVSSATAYVINRSLCMDPKDRHQSYEELIEHLNYARTKLFEKGTRSHTAKTDDVLFARQKKRVQLKFAAIATVALVAAVLLIFSNRIFHKQKATAEEVKKSMVTGLTEEQGYMEGRNQLIHGDFAQARDIFHELETRQKLPHPLDRWVMLHEGLSVLLGGQLKDSQTIFGKLAEKGVYSDAPEDRALADFFVDTARTVALGEPVAGTAAKNFDSDNFAALGLFILALDDWEMSHFDDADSLFQAFLASDPKQPYDWVAEYKPLAGKYTADLAAFKKVAAGAEAAGDLKKQKQAMEDLQALKSGLQVPGRLPEKLALIEADLQKKIDAGEADEKRRAGLLAQELDQETKVLAAAKAKYNAFLPGYQFAEAQDVIQKTQVSDPTLSLEKAGLLKKAQWLAQFKETLIDDINSTGYPLPVSKINSAPIEGGVNRATETQIEIQTKYGMVDVLWTELPPAEILAMAGYFTGKATPPESVVERQWLSGVFAMTAGMPREGKAFLEMASQSKPEYREEMALFESEK